MIERVVLATVTRVPEWHPEHASFEPFPVHGWVIRQPDGVVLVDTGIGVGNELIDQWYAPEVTLLSDAVADLNDVAALVLSHLHFDHCGQQAAVDAPVYVQSAEWEAAKRPRYSIPAWATIPQSRLRLIDGDAELAPGIRVMATPGHTRGHQSVVIDAAGERTVLAAQARSAQKRSEPVSRRGWAR